MPDWRQNQDLLIRTQVLSRTLPLVRELVEAEVLTDAEIVHRFAQVRVVLVADEHNLKGANGQTALITTLNLVARLGVAVVLDIPSVPLAGPQPPLAGDDLREALKIFALELFPGCSASVPDGRPNDIALVMGDTPWNGQARMAWRLSGSAWTGAISPFHAAVPCWQGDFPIGALASAALAAPEVFKYALRHLGVPPASGRGPFIDAVETAVHCVDEDAPDVFEPQGIELDCVSAGAITNAVLYTLFRVPGLKVKARVMDADHFEGSNQNRYVLALWRHMGHLKVDTLMEHASQGWEIRPIPVHYRNDSDVGLPLADNVMIGTDQIEPRWWVQSQWPKWLGVGSTSHFDIVVSEHTPGLPCAGCLHHSADDGGGDGLIPTVSFVSFWSGLLVAARLIRHVMGIPVNPRRQQTYLCPLQLDERHARMDVAVTSHPDCPVERTSRTETTEPF